MEELAKKLEQLRDLIKAVKMQQQPKPTLGIPKIPEIKPPSPPSLTPSAAAAPKISTGSGPNSKKDPKKVAQQIRDGSMSTKTQKVMLKAQWSDEDVKKADEIAQSQMYHIHEGPHRITKEPLTVKQIQERHGGIKKLENSGFVLHPHNATPAPAVKKADIRWEDPSDPASI